MRSWKLLVKVGARPLEPVSGGTSSPSHLRRESLECPHSQLISTLSAEGPALPSALATQIAEGVRPCNTKVAALISLAQAEGQFAAEEDPDLLASLFINCWQGAMIRTKCDPSAQCDCLRFALDRVLGASGGGGRNE